MKKDVYYLLEVILDKGIKITLFKKIIFLIVTETFMVHKVKMSCTSTSTVRLLYNSLTSRKKRICFLYFRILTTSP